MKKAICALCLAALLSGFCGAAALYAPDTAPSALTLAAAVKPAGSDPLAPWLDGIELVEPRDGISTNLSLIAFALVALGTAVLAAARDKDRR